MYPGAPAAARSTPVRRRPPPVTAVAVILIVMGLVGLLHALVGLAMMNRVVDHVRRAARGADVDAADVDALVWIVRGGAILAAILGVVFAVLLILLALGNLRGSNAARVSTWAVCGLGLFCGCASAIATVGHRGLPVDVADDPSRADLLRALGEGYPPWWIWLTGALSAAQALGYLVVALLLALPATAAFFRRPPSVGGPPPPPAPVTPPM